MISLVPPYFIAAPRPLIAAIAIAKEVSLHVRACARQQRAAATLTHHFSSR